MGKGGKGKGKGGKKPEWNEGPPEWIEEAGVVMHTCEEELVCKVTHEKVPMFNQRVFLEDNKENHIGKTDEIFGPINDQFFSITMSEGMKAASFKKGTKMFMDGTKFVPLVRFTNPDAGKGKGKGKGKGGKGKGGKKGGGKGGKKGVKGKGKK